MRSPRAKGDDGAALKADASTSATTPAVDSAAELAALRAELAAAKSDLAAAHELLTSPAAPDVAGSITRTATLLVNMPWGGKLHEAGAPMPFDPRHPPKECITALYEGVHYCYL